MAAPASRLRAAARIGTLRFITLPYSEMEPDAGLVGLAVEFPLDREGGVADVEAQRRIGQVAHVEVGRQAGHELVARRQVQGRAVVLNGVALLGAAERKELVADILG